MPKALAGIIKVSGCCRYNFDIPVTEVPLRDDRWALCLGFAKIDISLARLRNKGYAFIVNSFDFAILVERIASTKKIYLASFLSFL